MAWNDPYRLESWRTWMPTVFSLHRRGGWSVDDHPGKPSPGFEEDRTDDLGINLAVLVTSGSPWGLPGVCG
jgi:hypothetical protein